MAKRREETANSAALKRVDLPLVTDYLSTGSTLLDLAIADKPKGGFGVGRISQIYGVESSGKTVLVAEALGACQRKGGHVYFGDAEQSLDFNRASKLYGLDTTDDKLWHYFIPVSIEDLFDNELATILKSRTNRSKPGAVVVDSLSALPSEVEMKTDLKDTKYGVTRARQLSAAFRKYVHDLHAKKLAVLFVDQTRENVGVVFGDKYTTSGGKALGFYASTRVMCTVGGKVKNKAGNPIGVDIKFVVKKNKIAPPFRQGVLRIVFDYGIDDIASNLLWLEANEPKEFEALAKVVWGGKELKLDDQIAAIEDFDGPPTGDAMLVETVTHAWREFWKTPDRKPRRRG